MARTEWADPPASMAGVVSSLVISLTRHPAASHRPLRVTCLLVAIVVLSVGDLWMTLEHLRSVGMMEGNPIARLLIVHGTPLGLIGWKLASTGLAVFLLYVARRRAAGEVGAVVCCCILTWLTQRWVAYSDHVKHLTRDIPAIVEVGGDKWVSLTDGM